MKKRIIIISSAVILIAAFAVWFFLIRTTVKQDLTVKPKRGQFKLTVTNTGELRSKKSISIMGPGSARAVQIYQMKVTRLIPEGTVVDSGAFVAELDRSEIMSKIKDVQLSIQKYASEYQLKELDSTQELSNARDELENLTVSLEEKRLQKDLSAYEAPAIIRQAEIDLERTQRAYNQALKNYATKVKKAIANLSVVGSDLSREQQKLDNLMQISGEFTVKAPASGMVIYSREWNGRRKEVGSTINVWDPEVATLPDLTSMESITYINEIDIQKIKIDQPVTLGLDASPGKKLTGNVTRVANIGEQRRNSDSKVFEVVIKINESDTTLRPSMTTSNEILVQTVDNSLFLPLECIHTETIDNQKVTYVYKKLDGKVIKQQVELGLINENEAIILKGVDDNDDIMMTIPEKSNEMALNRLN